jgi:GNAT superfamily N-acetyltransferase
MTQILQAAASDLPALLPLVRDFYTEGHLAFGDHTLAALKQLASDARLGGIFLLRDGGGVKGYFVLTFGYSIERGGKTALLDELYVIPAARGKRLGKAAMEHAIAAARSAGCCALHLEVDRSNEKARAFYERAGFIELPRGYLTLGL